MLKNKYIYKIIVFFIILFFLYNAKDFVFSYVLKKQMSSVIGYESKIKKLHISPFFIYIKNLKTINDFIIVNDIKVEINLFSFINKSNFIKNIKIKNIVFELDKYNVSANNLLSLKHNIFLNKLLRSKINISINECFLVKKNIKFNFNSTDIKFNDNIIKIKSHIRALNKTIEINSLIEKKQKNIFSIKSSFISNNKINMYVDALYTTNTSSQKFYQNIIFNKLLFYNFDFNKTSCFISKKYDYYNIDINGNFGKINFNSLLKKNKCNLIIDISKINKNMSGKIKLDLQKKIKIDIVNLKINGLEYCDFKFICKKEQDGVYKISILYKKNILLINFKNFYHEDKIIIKNKTVGNINGNLKTGDFFVDVKNLNIPDIMPIVNNNFCNGIITINGFFNENIGKIKILIKNCILQNLMTLNITGVIEKNKKTYKCNFIEHDCSIILNIVFKDFKIIFYDLKIYKYNFLSLFNKYFKNVSCIFCNDSIGHIKYSLNNSIKSFLISISNIKIFNNKFKKIEVKCNIKSFDIINIDRIVFYDESNKPVIDINGLINNVLNKKNNSYVYVSVNDLNVHGIYISTYARFKIYFNNFFKFNGKLKCNNTKIDNIVINNIYSDIFFSKNELRILNIKSSINIDGNICLLFDKNETFCNLNVKNTNISNYCNGLIGFMNSYIKLYGKINNPHIKISFNINKGKYFSKKFFLLSDFEYFDNKVKIVKIVFDENFINLVTKFNFPIKGFFNGNGIINLKNIKKTKYFKLSVRSDLFYFQNKKFNDLYFDIIFDNKNIKIKNLSTKFYNSELKINNFNLDIIEKKYNFNLFIVNFNIYGFNLFGNIDILGNFTTSGNNIDHNGIVNFNDIWINKYKLHCFYLNYCIKNKLLNFYKTEECNLNKYNFFVSFFFKKNKPVFEIKLIKKDSILNLYVDFFEKKINSIIKNLNIDLNLITKILNLQNIFDGIANINLNLNGGPENFIGNMYLISKKGLIFNIPYDDFNIELNFNKSNIYIKTYIDKYNDISVIANGYIPNYINKLLLNKTYNGNMNISYKINDYKLNILKYISNGYIKNNLGKMFINGNINGNNKKINNNVKLLITNGSIYLKNYLNKINNIIVDISLDKNIVNFNNFSFKSAKSGKLNVYGQIELDKFNISKFDLRFITDEKGITLCIPQFQINSSSISNIFQKYSQGEPIFDISISGTPYKNKISGVVKLKNTCFSLPINNLYDNKLSMLSGTEFNLKILSDKNTKFESSFISGIINGNLNINGNYDNINITGFVNTNDGKINYSGIIFNILNASIEIESKNKIYITAKAETNSLSKIYNDKNVVLIIKRTNLFDLHKKCDTINLFFKKDNKLIENNIKQSDNFSFKDSNVIIQQNVMNFFDKSFVIPFVKTIFKKIKFVDNLKILYTRDYDYYDINDQRNSRISPYFLLYGSKYSLKKEIVDNFIFCYSICFDGGLDYKLYLHHIIEMKYKISNNLYLSSIYDFVRENEIYKSNGKIILKYILRFH
jgi:hypothetical protein